MRVINQPLLWGVLTLCFALSSVTAARAEEYSAVPTAVEAIGDTVIRDAMVQYSPNYNYLGRADQIRAYVNLYQAIRGAQPELTAADAVYLAQSPQPAYAAPETQTTYVVPQTTYVIPESQTYYVSPPPTYYYPSRPGFSFGFSYGNDRWHNRPGWGGHRPGWGGHRPPQWGGGHGRPPRPPGGNHGGPGGGRPPRPRPR